MAPLWTYHININSDSRVNQLDLFGEIEISHRVGEPQNRVLFEDAIASDEGTERCMETVDSMHECNAVRVCSVLFSSIMNNTCLSSR